MNDYELECLRMWCKATYPHHVTGAARPSMYFNIISQAKKSMSCRDISRITDHAYSSVSTHLAKLVLDRKLDKRSAHVKYFMGDSSLPEPVRKISVITRVDIRHLRLFKDHAELTSQDCAEIFDCDKTSSAASLNKLSMLGYITKVEVPLSYSVVTKRGSVKFDPRKYSSMKR